jgi:hypothetical protein
VAPPRAPAISRFVQGEPIIPARVFPFVFITIVAGRSRASTRWWRRARRPRCSSRATPVDRVRRDADGGLVKSSH